MSKTIHLTHTYPYSAASVWQVATDLDHLRRVTSGKITFRNLPSGSIFEGQMLEVDVSLFGLLPYQPYRMEVRQFDAKAMRFVSSEIGAGVKSWEHTLHVIDHSDHCQIKEHIKIDAGILTPAFCLWAKYLYRSRHLPRLAILKELSGAKRPA
ncbi:MAG: hypothetical protein ABJN34_08165 [Litoreibacter sp.]|uniref:hypothetical protein n=1 Tax=Litoreibacter sp. TaxID=1969459 RepID=UPI00329A5B90